jgi:hypothetical protein
MNLFVSYQYTTFYKNGEKHTGFGNSFFDIDFRITDNDTLQEIEYEVERSLMSGEAKEVIAFILNFKYIE